MRDYLAGSYLATLFSGISRGLFRKGRRLLRGVARTAGVDSVRSDPFRGACALLASAIAANMLTLWVTLQPLEPWGMVLRGTGLCAAGAGLLFQGEGRSLRDHSFFVRWLRKF